MHTLVLTEIFPPTFGGSGRYFSELYSRLPRDQYLIYAAETPTAAEYDRTHDLNLVRRPMVIGDRGIRRYGSLKFYLQTALRVRKLVKREGIGMIHCGRNLPEGFVGYLVNKLCGVPYLFFTHGEDISVSRRSREMTWMTRRVMAAARGAIGNSFNTRRLLIEEWGYPAERIGVIQPGVDTTRYVPVPRDEAQRTELGWSGRTVILTVGRLQKRKGQDMMIRALAAIRQSHPSVLYAIIGTGEEDAPLRELAKREGQQDHVQFIGGVSDDRMLQCHQQCDLFALPNRAVGPDLEGFGIVLLEAQACGKPVLAGNNGGTGETMDAPHTGVIVDCSEPEPLATAVNELLSDPTRMTEVGRRGRSWVTERFDWSNVAERAVPVFERFAATSG